MIPEDCSRCALYRSVREDRIRAVIARTSTSGTQAQARWAEFMAGVHDRHSFAVTLGRVSGSAR